MIDSTPTVTLRLPDGQEVTARAGAIIGRLEGAAVQIRDPRVSEAHALISLRGSSLRLIALRGALALGELRLPEIALSEGQEIRLAEGVVLKVCALSVPDHLLGLEIRAPGRKPRQWPLQASIYTITPGGLLLKAYREEGLVHLWSSAEGWYLQRPGQEAEALAVGQCWQVGELSLEGVEIPLGAFGADSTISPGRISPPLRMVARYDSVHLHPVGGTSLVLSGQSARILSELVLMDRLAPWEAVAGEIWKGNPSRDAQRQAWDQALRRLRAKLKEHRIRSDLIRSDGQGNIELYLLPEDELRSEM